MILRLLYNLKNTKTVLKIMPLRANVKKWPLYIDTYHSHPNGQWQSVIVAELQRTWTTNPAIQNNVITYHFLVSFPSLFYIFYISA